MNPLTVLEKVFFHLPVEDLKTCRLVNRAWSHESTITMRKLLANVPIGTPAALRGLIGLAKSSSTIPFTKFNFSSHFFSLPNCGPTFIQFLSILSPELESMTITLDKESGLLPSEETEPKKTYNFPKLSSVTFTGHGLDTSPSSDFGVRLPTIFTIILSSSPKIDALSLMMDSECTATVKQLFRFMSKLNSLKNLTSLDLYVPVGDEEILHLSQIPFQLKTLRCDFHRSCFLRENFQSFLSGQSSSLEYLKFDNYYGNSCYTVAFPLEMTQVKTLKIDGKSQLSSKEVEFVPFSYNKQLPNLTKLVLGGSVEFNKCWKIFFPEDTIVLSLKQLKLTTRYIDPVWVERAGTIFPHLEQLFFTLTPKNEPLSRAVFRSFTNVKELTIYFHPDTENVDHLFTGLSKSECQKLRENLGEGECRNYDDDEEVRDVGLQNLKSLKTLRLKADRKPTIPHISDVTIIHCFLQMKSLEAVTMPSFQISEDATAKLSSKVNLRLT